SSRTAYAVVRRSSYFSPAHAGLFCAQPGNAKGPVSDDGAFRTFLRWQGMLSDPANFSIRHALIWFQGPPLLALRARCWPPARASHRRKLWHQLGSSKLTKWAAAAAPHTWAGLQLVEVKLTARLLQIHESCSEVSCASQPAYRRIGGPDSFASVQSLRTRFTTGQRSEMAESLLDALEGSLRLFEKHRIFLLSCSGSSSAPPRDAVTGRSLSRHNGR